MNWLDYLLIAIFAYCLISGLLRGFIRSSIGLLSVILALFLGIWFYGVIGSFFLPYVSHRAIANILGFFIIFFGVTLAGSGLIYVLEKLVRWARLTFFDRMLGLLFGAVKAAVIGIAIVMGLAAFSVDSPPSSVAQSRIAPHLMTAAQVLAILAPRELREGFEDSYQKLRQLWKQKVKPILEHPPAKRARSVPNVHRDAQSSA